MSNDFQKREDLDLEYVFVSALSDRIPLLKIPFDQQFNAAQTTLASKRLDDGLANTNVNIVNQLTGRLED